jgi:hypothetical protein
MKDAILLLVVCSFFISGCGAQQRFGSEEDLNGRKLIGVTDEKDGFYERTLRTEDYNTNQNPNFLDLTEDRPDYGDDENKFREVITMNSELEPGPVYITGDTARVTAYAPSGISKKEKKRIKEDLARHYLEVMPRYHVKLAIKER